MIGRRDLLAGGAAMAAMAGTGFAAPTDVHFEVIRKGGKIGQQSVTFQQRDGVLVATTAAEIVVRFGPIALFRYTHSVRETWRDGQFETLDSTTDDDGKPFKVHAERGAAGVTVEASTIARAVLPPETIPLTHWNILCMERPLFNPQDGTRIDSRVIPRGEEMVALANGAMVRATHYSLVGKVALDDWYDAAKIWTALRSVGTDGTVIDYRRVV
jgi:hypothetical protein